MGQNSGKQLTIEAGCAYVWKAVDVNNSQQNYVLKVTKWNSNDTKMIERAKINIIILKTLQPNLNLVKFFGSDIHMENETCTIMQLFEYCPGGNLREYISQTAITQLIIQSIFKDICYALSALHTNVTPICHGNIHLENILVTGVNSFKLGDYDTLTFTNKAMTTVEQCEFEMGILDRLVRKEIRAPETFQYKPGSKITVKSDIWSLGILLYTLLFNSNPFADETGHIKKKVILKGDYQIPKNNYDPFLINLIKMMIVVDPNKRPTINEIIKKCIKEWGWKSQNIENNPVLNKLLPIDIISSEPQTPSNVAASVATPTSISSSASNTGSINGAAGGDKSVERSLANQISERVQAKFIQLVSGEKNNKRAWIMRCTSYHPGAPKFKYLRFLIIEANESKNIDFLYPMIKERNTNHPIVAIKCLIVILRILQQGPREILEQSYQYIDIPREIGEKWNHNIYQQTKNPFHIEYCRLIHQLSLLIVNKLEFVHNYPIYDSKYICNEAESENDLGIEDRIDILSRLFTISSIVESCESISFMDHPPLQAALSPLIDETQYLYGCLTKILSDLITSNKDNEDDDKGGSDEMTLSLIENYNSTFDSIKVFFDKCRDHPISTIKDIPELPKVSPLKNSETAPSAVHEAIESINRAAFNTLTQDITDDNQLENDDGEIEDDVILGNLYRQGPEGIVPLFQPKTTNLNGLSINEFVLKLAKQKDNNICMECKSKNVTHASFNLGLFLCRSCAILHLKLGSHISFVKALDNKNIKNMWIQPLIKIGNKMARSFWEFKLDEKDRPKPKQKKALKSFIKRKYLKREYIPDDAETPDDKMSFLSGEKLKESISNESASQSLKGSVVDNDIDLFADVNFNNNANNSNILLQQQQQQQQQQQRLSLPNNSTQMNSMILMQQQQQQLLRQQQQQQQMAAAAASGCVGFNNNNSMNMQIPYQYPNYIHNVSVPYNYQMNGNMNNINAMNQQNRFFNNNNNNNNNMAMQNNNNNNNMIMHMHRNSLPQSGINPMNPVMISPRVDAPTTKPTKETKETKEKESSRDSSKDKKNNNNNNNNNGGMITPRSGKKNRLPSPPIIQQTKRSSSTTKKDKSNINNNTIDMSKDDDTKLVDPLLELLPVDSPLESSSVYENPFLSNADDGVVEDEEEEEEEEEEKSDNSNEDDEDEDDDEEEDNKWSNLPPKPAIQVELNNEEDRAKLALAKVLEDFKVSNITIPYNDIQMGKRIGIGGFATVYKGVYHQEIVAVKRLLMTKMNDKAIKDFHSEVNLMHRLSHPNIVVFKGLVFDPVCLVTEFCENGNLFDLLHLKNSETKEYIVQLPWQLRLKLSRDVARGMNFLHTQPTPIIHRDLKSLNILVNSRWTAKISDFGLSRFKAGDGSQALMTSQCGTFQWMAPEVIGGQLYSEKADIYSFGINLWEIYTRQTPYAGLEPLQVAMVVHTHRRRPTIPPDCPQWYSKLISDCWAHDPNKRPTFKEIILRLKEGGPEPNWTDEDLKYV